MDTLLEPYSQNIRAAVATWITDVMNSVVTDNWQDFHARLLGHELHTRLELRGLYVAVLQLMQQAGRPPREFPVRTPKSKAKAKARPTNWSQVFEDHEANAPYVPPDAEGRFNINRIGVRQLMGLGVGRTVAERIITRRDIRCFESFNDLATSVQGLGTVKMNQLGPRISFHDPISTPVPASLSTVRKINLNTAGVRTLCTLPGIQEVLANRIIRVRDGQLYTDMKDVIARVPYFGEQTAKGVAPFVCFR